MTHRQTIPFQASGRYYDRAYYLAYGIDPDEVMPRPRREIKAPWPTPDGLDCDVWQLTPTCAVCIEDPNGPHPVAYEYEIESRPCWTLRQVYALTPDEVWRMVGGRGRMGGAEASKIYLAFCRAVRRDLSAYWTDAPKPPTCGERCHPEPQEPERSSVPAAMSPKEEPKPPKPRQRRHGLRLLGFAFES